jgi:chemotaxis family two-component system response regulator Rcp1
MTDRPLTILIAEDNVAHRQLTEYALKKNPHPITIVSVHDGQEVLDRLAGKGEHSSAGVLRPDLILLDLNLPKRDGREVLSLLKADPSTSAIPVVIISTSDREEDVRRAFDAGARAYISKSKGFDRYAEEISHVTKYVAPPAGSGARV